MLTVPKRVKLKGLENLVTTENLLTSLKSAVKYTELFKRRFRHVAVRSFMILKNYKGREISIRKQHRRSQRILDVLMLKLKRGLKRLTETNETLRRRNAVLVEEINYLRNHGGYLELQAHKLGLVKKGEIVFQFKEDR